MEGLSALLAGNPYFSAGAGLFGLGVVTAIARKGSVYGVAWARRKLLVSIEIPSRDRSYDWFLKWMSKNVNHTQHLSITTRHRRLENGLVTTKFDFLPSVGSHFMKYKSTWIHVQRQREKQTIDLNSGSLWESVTLTMLGRDKEILFRLLEESKVDAMKETEGTTIIYTSYGPDWRPFGYPRNRRPLDSVILAGGITDRIVRDVKDFLANASWYIERGIPYRRGYLLHGLPGSGKSSFIQALAGALEYNICILSLSDQGLTDDRLNHLLVVAPERTLILLEDIDAAFTERAQSTKYHSQVTFSGLLNALDGVAAGEGRILFMTTNHLSRLDPALIRPGRVDVIEKFGNADSDQVKGLWNKFYPTNADLANQFAAKVPAGTVSMAALQGYLLLHKNKPFTALDEVEGYFVHESNA